MKPIQYQNMQVNDETEDEWEIENIGDISDGKNQVYIYFDFECTQDDLIQCDRGYEPNNDTGKCNNCGKSLCGSFEHRPNLCVVHKVCTKCLNREVNTESRCDHCGKNERVFTGENTTNDFCKWLFSEENTGATVLCHNFKGYDSFPVLNYLYQNGILPKVIPNGAKNMAVEVPVCKIRMLDSINFLPMALSKLPEMFGINELSKGYFPHLYNRKENQRAILLSLPNAKYYNPDAMKPEDRQCFLVWHEEHQNDTFHFQEELLK